MSYRVRPSFGYKIGVGSSNFRPDESVLTPTLWLVDVRVGWHHIEIPDHQDRDLELKKPGRVVLTGIPSGLLHRLFARSGWRDPAFIARADDYRRDEIAK